MLQLFLRKFLRHLSSIPYRVYPVGFTENYFGFVYMDSSKTIPHISLAILSRILFWFYSTYQNDSMDFFWRFLAGIMSEVPSKVFSGFFFQELLRWFSRIFTLVFANFPMLLSRILSKTMFRTIPNISPWYRLCFPFGILPWHFDEFDIDPSRTIP